MSLSLLLATELVEDVAAGYDVYGISAPGPYVDDVERLGVRHVAVPEFSRAWSLRDDALAARQLWHVLRELDVDILHTHTPKAGVLGRVLGRIAGIPVVVNTCHGLWVRPEDGLARKAFVYGAESVAGWCSHFELYQNDEDRRTMRWVVRRRRAKTVGNGVDLERFVRDETARRRVRQELGVSDSDVLVGGVGRRVEEKGIPELVVAAGHLAGAASFVWVGPDDDSKPDRLRATDGVVRFVGARTDMPAVYSAFDVFVLPSHREGFSRSAMEAAACGCALVLSDVRGCREIGVDGEHAVFVPPRNADALEAALRRVITDGDFRRRLGESAAARARTEFDQRAVARASFEAYGTVAKRRRLAWEAALPERNRAGGT